MFIPCVGYVLTLRIGGNPLIGLPKFYGIAANDVQKFMSRRLNKMSDDDRVIIKSMYPEADFSSAPAARKSKRIKITQDMNALEKRVARMVNRHAQDCDNGAVDFLADVLQGGCQSGIEGELIYYTDTLRFYRRYQDEINAMLTEALQESGIESPAALFGDKWDNDDPLARDTLNQNLLAWFGYEETCRKFADALEA